MGFTVRLLEGKECPLFQNVEQEDHAARPATFPAWPSELCKGKLKRGEQQDARPAPNHSAPRHFVSRESLLGSLVAWIPSGFS